MNIYVGNLSYEVAEDDLQQAFEGFGEVTSVNIIKDRWSGQSRGFGFVEMPTKAQAQSAIEGFHLDEILFVPASRQPHKQNQKITLVQTRLKLLNLALDDDRRFEISDIELKRSGLSYTCDTLAELKSIYPESLLYLIIGGDNIKDIETWKNPESIFSIVKVVAASRPGFSTESKYIDRIDIFDMPQIGISSSMIRQKISQGKSVRYLVSDKVEKYITENKLYI